MTGGNVTIGGTNGLATTNTVTASGDSLPAWSATGSYTYQAFPSMIVLAGVNSLGTATSATAGVATLPSGPVGFISITVGGTAYKLPYYAV